MSENINYSDFRPSYTQADVEGVLRAPQLDAGIYKFAVVDATAGISKGGHMMLTLSLLPYDATDNLGGPGIRNYLVLPFETPPELLAKAEKVQSKKPGKWAIDNCRRYISATNHEVLPTYPQFDKETKSWTLDGEAISKEEADSIRTAVTAEVMDYMTEAWVDPGILKGNSFYGRVSYKEGSDFPNLDVLVNGVPEGEEVSYG